MWHVCVCILMNVYEVYERVYTVGDDDDTLVANVEWMENIYILYTIYLS